MNAIDGTILKTFKLINEKIFANRKGGLMLIDNQNRLFFGFALENLNLEYEIRIIKADLLGAVPL